MREDEEERMEWQIRRYGLKNRTGTEWKKGEDRVCWYENEWKWEVECDDE